MDRLNEYFEILALVSINRNKVCHYCRPALSVMEVNTNNPCITIIVLSSRIETKQHQHDPKTCSWIKAL